MSRVLSCLLILSFLMAGIFMPGPSFAQEGNGELPEVELPGAVTFMPESAEMQSAQPLAASEPEVTFTFGTESQREKFMIERMKISPSTVRDLLRDEGRLWEYLGNHQEQLRIKVYKQGSSGSLEPVVPTGDSLVAPQPFISPIPVPLGKRNYLPYIAAGKSTNPPIVPDIPLTADTLKERIQSVSSYLNSLVKTDAAKNMAFASEWGGAMPLWIKNSSRPDLPAYPRMVGFYKGDPITAKAYGQITTYAIGVDYDIMAVEFEPYAVNTSDNWSYPIKLWAQRTYSATGQVEYLVELRQNDTYDTIELYLGKNRVFPNLSAITPGTYAQLSGYRLSFPTLRYMMRIDAQTGRYFEQIYHNTTTAEQLGNALKQFNYLPTSATPGWDYWYAAYGAYPWLDDGAYSLWETYPDCRLANNGSDSVQPWGGSTYVQYYPYNSKVCRSLAVWDTAARQDHLMPPLTALHILNKYGDPDRPYKNPRTYGVSYTTPREEAKYLESKWNGSGIPNFGRDAKYSSALRTDIFWMLETILGYQYGDPSSRTWADTVAAQAMYRVWGLPPYTNDTVYTEDWGEIARPNFHGAPFNFWMLNPDGKVVFARPDISFIQDALDIFNMPQEVQDPGPIGVFEAAQSYMQAGRIYLHHRYGQTIFSANLLAFPRHDTKLAQGNYTGLAIPYKTGWRARDLLNALVAQGANPGSVVSIWNGVQYVCTASTCPDVPNVSLGYYNFPLASNQGYLVYARNPIQFRAPGEPYSTILPIKLTAAKGSIVSVPFATTTGGLYWASTLTASIRKAGCTAARVGKRNMAFPNSWTMYDGTNDFPIEPDTAYYIDTGSKGCTFVP